MFPSTLSVFPRPSTTSRLDSPSHSSLHNQVSSALGQVEAVIGVEGANSVVGTIMYDIQSPDSNGGGHVQSANKGGTGQTSYTKGDLLVASSSSVLTKLAVGSDGQALVANSSTATGVNWAIPQVGKVNVNASLFSFFDTGATTAESSVFSINIPGSTLGTNNAIRATAFVQMNPISTGSVLARARFAGGVYASVMIRAQAGVASISGQITTHLMANNSASQQRGILEARVANQLLGGTSSILQLYNMNTSSVNSSANQTLGLTVMGGDVQIIVQGVIVEKIV